MDFQYVRGIATQSGRFDCDLLDRFELFDLTIAENLDVCLRGAHVCDRISTYIDTYICNIRKVITWTRRKKRF